MANEWKCHKQTECKPKQQKKGKRKKSRCRAATTRHYTHFKRFSITLVLMMCRSYMRDRYFMCVHSLYASSSFFCLLHTKHPMFIGSLWVQVFHQSSRIKHAEQVLSWSGIFALKDAALYIHINIIPFFPLYALDFLFVGIFVDCLSCFLNAFIAYARLSFHSVSYISFDPVR